MSKEPKKISGHQRKGTHGSLTKAGKMSEMTKNERRWRLRTGQTIKMSDYDSKTQELSKSKPRKAKGKGSKGDLLKKGLLHKNRKTPRTNIRRKYNKLLNKLQGLGNESRKET